MNISKNENVRIGDSQFGGAAKTTLPPVAMIVLWVLMEALTRFSIERNPSMPSLRG